MHMLHERDGPGSDRLIGCPRTGVGRCTLHNVLCSVPTYCVLVPGASGNRIAVDSGELAPNAGQVRVLGTAGNLHT